MKLTMTESFMSEMQVLVIDTIDRPRGYGENDEERAWWEARHHLADRLDDALRHGAKGGRYTLDLDGLAAARLLYELWSWSDIWQEWGFEGAGHIRQANRIRREILAKLGDDPHVVAEEQRRTDWLRRPRAHF